MTVAGGGPAPRMTARVLLVDDEPLGRMLARQHLPPGYEVTECADAETALRTARSTSHDVALVDVQLPGLDGFQLCRLLKRDPLTAEMPVIVVTARSGIEDLERGFEAGATDYVRKPFNPRELAARVRNAVELKQRGDSIRRWHARLAEDLALAGALQHNLLSPRPFLHERLRIHTAYQSSLDVGGDLFDMVTMRDGRFAVYVGDVAGHGVGAAIASTLLKVSLGDLLRTHVGAGPASIANELHRIFLKQLRTPGLYATLFLALIDPVRKHWQCLNCGHPAPIVIAPESLTRHDFESRGGVPVGLSLAGDAPFRTADEIHLELPGEVMVLMATDGLLDAENAAHPEASTRLTLAELIADWRRRRHVAPMPALIEGMQQAGFRLDNDDCTALLVEQVPESEILLDAARPATLEGVMDLAHELETALRGASWPEESIWAAHLLLVEHGVNAVRHGRPSSGSWVAVQARLGTESLELLVRDSGQPWSYDEAPVVEARAREEHGRGVMMIRRIASYLASHRDGHENVALFGLPRNWRPPT